MALPKLYILPPEIAISWLTKTCNWVLPGSQPLDFSLWSCNFSYFSGLPGPGLLYSFLYSLRRTNTWSILPGVTEGALSTEMGVQARGHYAAQDWLFCSILHSVGEDSWAHIHYTWLLTLLSLLKTESCLPLPHSPTQEQKLNKNKNKNVRLFSLHVEAKTLEH